MDVYTFAKITPSTILNSSFSAADVITSEIGLYSPSILSTGNPILLWAQRRRSFATFTVTTQVPRDEPDRVKLSQ